MSLFQWLKNAGAQPRTAPAPGAPQTPPVRRRYHFSGLVQGVGFRWEAKALAARLGLTGWAKNETDGTVTVEVQGGETRVREFLRAMRAVSRFDITEIQTVELAPREGETAFGVRY
mgnify:CR=1 FL=1